MRRYISWLLVLALGSCQGSPAEPVESASPVQVTAVTAYPASTAWSMA